MSCPASSLAHHPSPLAPLVPCLSDLRLPATQSSSQLSHCRCRRRCPPLLGRRGCLTRFNVLGAPSPSRQQCLPPRAISSSGSWKSSLSDDQRRTSCCRTPGLPVSSCPCLCPPPHRKNTRPPATRLFQTLGRLVSRGNRGAGPLCPRFSFLPPPAIPSPQALSPLPWPAECSCICGSLVSSSHIRSSSSNRLRLLAPARAPNESGGAPRLVLSRRLCGRRSGPSCRSGRRRRRSHHHRHPWNRNLFLYRWCPLYRRPHARLPTVLWPFALCWQQ